MAPTAVSLPAVTHSIRFEDVRFRYRRTGPHVFDGLSWCLPPGRTVLLGPNGAGKTTLLALGADALRPNSGRVRWGPLEAGDRHARAAYRRAVGWMPQHVRAVPGLTCQEQVAYAAWLKGASREAAWRDAADALHQVAMTDLAGRLTSQVSGGQLRRIGLAQVLAHHAQILLLDEPTVGLDPAQRARFRELLTAIPDHIPVVISTHQVDDLADLFDTVVVIDRGIIRFDGSVESFLGLATDDSERRAESAYATIMSRDA